MTNDCLGRETTVSLMLMFSGMVFFGASLFGTMALLLLSWVAFNDEGMHPIAVVSVSMMLMMGIWNMRASIRLFNEPRLRCFAWIIGRSVIALCPIFGAFLFLK